MKPKVIQFYVDEWHNRYVVLSDGSVYRARNRGVAGANYDKWYLWDILAEIKKDSKREDL